MPLPAGLGVPKRPLECLESLTPGKRQAWTPIMLLMWPWCLCLRGWEAKNAFGRFEAWQTTRLHVIKRRLERLEAGFGVFACGVGGAKKAFGAFRGFEAWQTAGLNAKKQLLMWPWCLCLRGWGAKKVFGAFGEGLVSLPAGLGVPKKRLERLEGLRPGKQHAWMPIKSYWCGLGVFACGVGVPKRCLERLERAWCLCLRGWGCQKSVWSVWRVWGLANSTLECQ